MSRLVAHRRAYIHETLLAAGWVSHKTITRQFRCKTKEAKDDLRLFAQEHPDLVKWMPLLGRYNLRKPSVNRTNT